ncbi:MAG: carboxymuconolactone decarboxylase family protein [Telmatospirillum sp.]|nr:carboxymuconolactone decarboxylase family protein [Telmatospirillum sp.]
MSSRPRELLNDFMNGLHEVGKTNGEVVNAFMGLLKADYKTAAVDTKTKELISVAIGTFTRCEYCIVFHVYKAYEAGATAEEIMEAALIAVAFGGGPSMAYTAALVKDSIKEFADDFKK